MEKINVVILTGRTLQQGIGLEIGKVSEEYSKSVNYAEISESDSKTLDINDGSPVKVTTNMGDVVLNGKISRTLLPGLIFVPYGPWVNQVLGTDTNCTGTPHLKGVKATIELVKNEHVPSIQELVKKMRKP